LVPGRLPPIWPRKGVARPGGRHILVQ